MNLVLRDGRFVGFRPEHLLPADHVHGPDRTLVPFRVERIEASATGTQARPAASARRPGSSPGCRPRSRPRSRPGRPTSPAVHADRLRFFDADSGRRADPVPVGG